MTAGPAFASVESNLPRRTPYRTWPGALAVFVIVVAYVGGLITWNTLTPSPHPVEPGTRIEVGHGLEYVPAAGWTLDAPTIQADQSHGVVRETAGLSIAVHAWKGSPDEPLERARRTLRLAMEPRFLTGAQAFRTAAGLQGQRIGYSGKSVQGEFWLVVDPQRQLTVTVNAHATPSQYAKVQPQVRAMIDSLQWKAPP